MKLAGFSFSYSLVSKDFLYSIKVGPCLIIYEVCRVEFCFMIVSDILKHGIKLFQNSAQNWLASHFTSHVLCVKQAFCRNINSVELCAINGMRYCVDYISHHPWERLHVKVNSFPQVLDF